MRVLLTGATGFFGRRLLDALLDRPEFTHVVGTGRRPWAGPPKKNFSFMPADLTCPAKTAALVAWAAPDAVLHAAGNAVVRPDPSDEPAHTRDNALATHNLLACCRDELPFLYVSSATVYGNWEGPVPFAEGGRVNPSSAYAATKLAGEHLCRAYGDSGRVRPLVVRPVAMVGGGATHGLLPDLVRKLRGPDPTLDLLGDEPGSSKPYVHVADAAAFVATLLSGWAQKIMFSPLYNVSPDDQVSVLEAAKLAMEVTGVVKPVRWLGASANWAGDQRNLRVSSWKATASGFRPSCPTSADAVRRALTELSEEN